MGRLSFDPGAYEATEEGRPFNRLSNMPLPGKFRNDRLKYYTTEDLAGVIASSPWQKSLGPRYGQTGPDFRRRRRCNAHSLRGVGDNEDGPVSP